MPEFRLAGSNPGFRDIVCHGATLREALDVAKADIVRQAIGFTSPLISAALFEAQVNITRLELHSTDELADETETAFFAVDVAVYLNDRAAVETPQASEIAWFHKRAIALADGARITKTFMVYGDDPSFED